MLKLDVRDGGVYVADADAEPDPTEFGRVARLLAAYDDEEEEAVDSAADAGRVWTLGCGG